MSRRNQCVAGLSRGYISTVYGRSGGLSCRWSDGKERFVVWTVRQRFERQIDERAYWTNSMNDLRLAYLI